MIEEVGNRLCLVKMLQQIDPYLKKEVFPLPLLTKSEVVGLLLLKLQSMFVIFSACQKVGQKGMIELPFLVVNVDPSWQNPD